METITMWTKQHKSVLETLNKEGRYTAKRKFIMMDLEEHAHLVFEVYDWLVKHMPGGGPRPEDAEYPVWASYSGEAVMLPDDRSVILEFAVDPAIVTPLNIIKWGMILNYSYIPDGEEDASRHRELLNAYRVSDSQAFMSQFYPQIKREIIESWDRLFDDRILFGNDYQYGIMWELRKEWITKVVQ